MIQEQYPQMVKIYSDITLEGQFYKNVCLCGLFLITPCEFAFTHCFVLSC